MALTGGAASACTLPWPQLERTESFRYSASHVEVKERLGELPLSKRSAA